MNGIEVYSSAYSKEYCNDVIKAFNRMSALNQTYTQSGIHKNSDERIMFDWAAGGNTMFNQDFNLCAHFFNVLNTIYTEQYVEKYDILKTFFQHTPKGMSVQKTLPHQGYHSWHTEVANSASSSRVAAYILYLNDVPDGGETEFLYHGVKVTPEAGKLLIFPTSYTHPHRGNPIYTGEKYIISGWFTFDH